MKCQMNQQTGVYECVISEDESAQTSPNVFEWGLHGNVAGLESLVRTHPEHLVTCDPSGATPLHYAAAGGSQRAIGVIAKAIAPEDLNARDEQGNTPLHWAVEKKQAESCSALLDLGADPNVLNHACMAPLHLAISLQHNALVELLLGHSKTDANLEGDLGNTPVMLACSIDNHEALCILLDHGAKMCHQNRLGHFAIHAAAFAGAKKSMEVILKKGEEIGHPVEQHMNCLDKSFCSPLHLAVRGGNIEVIRLCIENGAKIDQQQCDKSTALHFACTQGATEAIKLMLSSYSRPEDVINITDGAHQTPLHRATIFDHVELAEYLILKGADIDCVDCKGHSPLLLATSCGAWKTVEMLVSRGANLKIKDKFGCNFLHIAVLQPKGLKNLPEEVLQNVKDLLSDEDDEGCTPLHYACKLGIPESVKNILGLQVSLGHKSKQKKSALHFTAEYGRINTCHRLLETITDARLLNEGDERGLTPLHLASRGGHTKVVQLLLRKGALFHSDYKGWTCLHHAASQGFTRTMSILLSSNINLLDKADEDGNTALHLAAKEGHTSAVRMLLDRGAKITLNKNDASFFHEAVHHGRKDTANTIIKSERCTEAFKVSSAKRCIVRDLIEFLPESCKCLLDTCVKESDDDVNSYDYCVHYNFRCLQAPIQAGGHDKQDKGHRTKPLVALNAMVHFDRIELLTHPLCKKYLQMKWSAYGVKAHVLNLAVYSLGLLPLSFLIVKMRPTISMTGNGTSINMVSTSLDQQSYFLTSCMFLVVAMNLYAIGKEVVQIMQQGSNYFRDASNGLDWVTAVMSLLFVVPLLMDIRSTLHWQAGAWAILASWMNFLLYLQRFEHFGIYVVMVREIMRTLLSIIILFFFLMLAFALSFYALLIGQRHFGGLDLSVMQTFVMMVGEINYQENFLTPYLKGTLPFPFVTYVVFIWFVLLIPILLMNLLIGLAVGDIAEVQRNAALKRIAMQIDLHTNLEERLPYWIMRRVDQDEITEYPNRACKAKLCSLVSAEARTAVHTRLNTATHQSTPLEQEMNKQKYRLKEMSSMLEKQHQLLKLIIQKMEIYSEAEDPDGPQIAPGPKVLSQRSKWIPLLKAVRTMK
ncbi:transient receptor potential cation channel subfamily A member 1-like [Megalops cyprinoides]|uniref:transient receptor potential cation channel subfamily A member 1-like n=1 Tax=Megalops cyprinoides TaxID=118141 RepID=UPI0018645B7F|nr:transient receptor potential cation channel subfamily A member 1-like [Megalops cyprinoides]